MVEGVVNYVSDLVTSTLGKRGEPFVPFFIALFVFIFLINQFGMLPFKPLGCPFGGSPTADINTVVPLALTVSHRLDRGCLSQNGCMPSTCSAIRQLLPINISKSSSRPVTLAARLFFNIFVGELLFIVVASIIRAHVMIGPLNLSLAVDDHAILHSVLQLFRRHGSGVRLYLAGDRLFSLVDPRRT